ncbi:MAG: hypothetical protein DRJ08_01910 [Acidobacteria bacterium]|nr:MAG: hypothetical protein DRJ08_01910 [Acidobacteriota bacterium]
MAGSRKRQECASLKFVLIIVMFYTDGECFEGLFRNALCSLFELRHISHSIAISLRIRGN